MVPYQPVEGAVQAAAQPRETKSDLHLAELAAQLPRFPSLLRSFSQHGSSRTSVKPSRGGNPKLELRIA